MRSLNIEIRNGKVKIDGYVNAVQRDSRPIPSPDGRFLEQVMPGTFKKALDNADVVEFRLNHKRVLGTTKDEGVRLFEDSIGLRAIYETADPEIIEKAENNQLRGWSFGFYVNEDVWDLTGPDGMRRRYLKDIDLTEVSIIDSEMTPAYIATSIETRDDKEVANEKRGGELEANLTVYTEEKRADPKIDYTTYIDTINKLKKRGKQ
ncbi:MAG TPA: HK97 family phage prohead protease [Clostridiaceae bacterium]|nr:HK97 family phage prohead protease [Clostridiaceae bacterium]